MSLSPAQEWELKHIFGKNSGSNQVTKTSGFLVLDLPS